MAGTTSVHHNSISYFQGRDIRGRFQSGQSHLTDNSGIITPCFSFFVFGSFFVYCILIVSYVIKLE